MDFIERLCERVNKTPNLPFPCTIGYLDTEDSLCVFSNPGGQELARYMDGEVLELLNYQFEIKSKKQSMAHNTLWAISNAVDRIKDLPSADGSYSFEEIPAIGQPYPIDCDEKGVWRYALEIQAKLITKEEE